MLLNLCIHVLHLIALSLFKTMGTHLMRKKRTLIIYYELKKIECSLNCVETKKKKKEKEKKEVDIHNGLEILMVCLSVLAFIHHP